MKKCKIKSTICRLLSLLIILLSTSIFGSAVFGEEITRNLKNFSAPPDLTAMTWKQHHPKLESTLAAVVEAAKSSVNEGVARAQNQGFRLSKTRILIQVTINPEGLKNVVDAILAAGGEVTNVAFNNTHIQAWLPVSDIEALATNDDVFFICRPAVKVPQEGNSATEALDDLFATAWHQAGYTGEGDKIGIIDGSFAGYKALLGIDLPVTVTAKNFVAGETDAQVDGGDNHHGTACAEIIYDIAPTAQLYLAKSLSSDEDEAAVSWLINQGVDIISTSYGYFNVSPGDGTGQLAEMVTRARNAGILWVTSAGNYREKHWGGSFYDPDGDNIHNYGDTQNVNYVDGNNGVPYRFPEGEKFCVYIRWDDWTNVDQDYDLTLIRWDNSISAWQRMPSDSGKNPQTGLPGQKPTEYACIKTSGEDMYGFIIERKNATRNVHLEIFAPGSPPLVEAVHVRSLGNLADAPNAMTVAAMDAAPPYPQETYSSEGPTNGPGGTAMGGFIKPDISGYANVSTESYGDKPFYGTSAAAPHVAGAAALVLDAYPHYGPDELQSYLEEKAIDAGTPGLDTQFGFGRLYLDDPPPPDLPPGKPTSIDYPPGDVDGSFPVSWSPVIEADSYTLDSATNSSFTGATTVYNGPATTYNETGLSDGTYYYHVRANNEYGSSDWRAGGPIVIEPNDPEPEIKVTDSVFPPGDLLVSFGEVTEDNSTQQIVTVTNIGDANLVIGSVGSIDPLGAPFEINENICSEQTIPPKSSCTITLNFSPTTMGTWDDHFDIPSNDPDENSVKITVIGTGLLSDTNTPSTPQLTYPEDGQTGLATTVTFRWGKCSDPNNDKIFYDFYYCTNRDFTSCNPIHVATASPARIGYAAFSLLGGIPVFLLALWGRKRMSLLLAIVMIAGAIVWVSCGGGGGVVPTPSEEVTSKVSGLESNTTYYWKVMAKNSGGGEANSVVQSFTTGQ